MGHLKTYVHLDNHKTIAFPQKGKLAQTARCLCWWSQDGYFSKCMYSDIGNLYMLNVVYFYEQVFSALHMCTVPMLVVSRWGVDC